MNQIKLKIQEIGLSQREISTRLGKNPSYLAGVFRSGLSTAKQTELMSDLEIVAGGGTLMGDEELIKDLFEQLNKAKEGNAGLRAESDKYFNELNKTKSDFEMMGKFFDQCKRERWDYQEKYKFVMNFNYVLCVIILGIVILWSVV